MLVRLSTSITGSDDDADDVAQETLIKLWYMSRTTDTYHNIDALARVIARNASLNVLRTRRCVPLDNTEIIDEYTDDSTNSLSDEIIEAVNRLPDTEQIVLRMKHLDGMETDEIARLIDSTPGAVRTALSRARRRIYNMFTQSKHV